MNRRKPTLCVDFDGVLHAYTSGWHGPGIVRDLPVPGAMAWLLDMLDHYEVAIYSSRNKSWRGRIAMKHWLVLHLGYLYLTPAMEDERTAFEVRRRWASPMTWEDEQENAAAWGEMQVKRLRFPLFKPAAFLTIDDRALTFTGNFADFGLRELKLFRPWNKRREVTHGAGEADGQDGAQAGEGAGASVSGGA